ncbi:hypothetical protein [Phaeobacter sp. NW0010-22]|uniref:hypothetical protein n=1 Tax=Phaeobacter sp. NW0010-22 TaxID=3135907 RepID=UPI003108BC88
MRFYTMTFPLSFAALLTVGLIFLPGELALTGKQGFLTGLLGTISLLPGFYIASLAAVATFGGEHMDETMPSPAPKVFIKTAQTEGSDELTRRMFLSYLFGYLAIVSLLLVAACFLLGVVAPGIRSLIETQWPTHAVLVVFSLKTALVFSMSFVLGSILVTTLHGTYYLMERIFQPT